MQPSTKFCGSCRTEKPVSEFNKHSGKPDGLQTQCKACMKVKKRKYDSENKDKKRNNYLLRTYGITLDEYNDLYNEQDGQCGVCGRHQVELDKALAVDHCHETMDVRGLLCTDCNLAIGKLGDNADGLRKALEYLENN